MQSIHFCGIQKKQILIFKWCLILFEHLWKIALLMNAVLLSGYVSKMLFEERYFNAPVSLFAANRFPHTPFK